MTNAPCHTTQKGILRHTAHIPHPGGDGATAQRIVCRNSCLAGNHIAQCSNANSRCEPCSYACSSAAYRSCNEAHCRGLPHFGRIYVGRQRLAALRIADHLWQGDRGGANPCSNRPTDESRTQRPATTIGIRPADRSYINILPPKRLQICGMCGSCSHITPCAGRSSRCCETVGVRMRMNHAGSSRRTQAPGSLCHKPGVVRLRTA